MERHAERHHTLRLLTFNKTSQVVPWYLFRVTCRKALQSRHCDIHWCQTAWGRCHMLTNSPKRWRSTLFPKSTIWQKKNDQRLDNWQLMANPTSSYPGYIEPPHRFEVSISPSTSRTWAIRCSALKPGRICHKLTLQFFVGVGVATKLICTYIL